MNITDIKGAIKRKGVYRSKENDGGAVSLAIAVVFILYLIVRSLA